MAADELNDQSVSERPPAASSQVLRLPTAVPALKAIFDENRQAIQQILDERDFQEVSQRGKTKTFMTRSAYQKIATAFGLTELVDRARMEVGRDSHGRPIYAAAVVVMKAPNGRLCAGAQEAHAIERCCPAAFSEPCSKRSYDSHTCCEAGCSGYGHWNHPGDIAATAHTRARNRAISDMVGLGDESAEETRDDGESRRKRNGTSEKRPAGAGKAEDAARTIPAAAVLYEQGPAMSAAQERMLLDLVNKLDQGRTLQDDAGAEIYRLICLTGLANMLGLASVEPIDPARLTVAQASKLITYYKSQLKSKEGR